MEAEAAPIVERLDLRLDDPRIIPGPCSARSFSGTVHDLAVHLVVNGTFAWSKACYPGKAGVGLF